MEGLIPINKRTKQFAIRIAKLYSFSPFPQLFNLSPLLFTSDSVSLKPAAHRNMSAANPTTATPPLVSDPLSPNYGCSCKIGVTKDEGCNFSRR